MTKLDPLTSEAPLHVLPPGLIHDLLTPLNQILGYSEMLIEQAREQGQENLIPDLQKTHAAGKRLLALVQRQLFSFPFDRDGLCGCGADGE